MPRIALGIATAAFIALAVLASIASFDLRTDNSIEHWLDPSSVATNDYEQFRQQFGADEFIVVAISGKPLFEISALDAMLRAQDNLLTIDGVHRVAGIPAVYRDLFGGEDVEALEEEFSSTPFYRGLFISDDRAVAGLFLEIDPPRDAPQRRAMVHAVDAAVQPLRDYGFRVDLVGPPTLNVALDDMSERETLRSMPIALACSVVVLMLLLRGVRATLIACVCAWISVALPMGLIDVTGYPLTMVSSVLPPLLWALSLAHSVHFLTQYYHHRDNGDDTHTAVAQAWRDVRLPCLLAAITTAAGFLSLVFSSMPPIRQMGAFASIAIVISVAANLSVAPTLTQLLRVPARHRAQSIWLPLLMRAEQFAERRTWSIVIVFAVVAAIGAISITQLRPEPNPLTFLPQDHPAVTSYNFVSEHLTGLSTLEVEIDCSQGWVDPESWKTIDTLSRELEQIPAVARVISPLDLLRKLNQWDNNLDPATYALPETNETAQRLLDEMPPWARAELNRLVAPDGNRIRLSLMVRTMSASSFYSVASQTRDAFTLLGPGLTANLTGIVLLLNDAQVQLVTTQIKSFAFSFVFVFLLIGLGLRSLRSMLLSIAPTLAPTLTAFAVMLLLGIPLDAATVLVAGVALGMADDSTIHLIAAYRRLRIPGQPAGQALSVAMGEAGPGIIYATGTSCIGFLTLCTSGFVPIRYFGFLSGVALLAAMLANLLLAPAVLLLMTRYRRGPESGDL